MHMKKFKINFFKFINNTYVLTLIFAPKISFINLPSIFNVQQGVRIEDIFTLLYGIVFFKKILPHKILIYALIYLTLNSLVANIFNQPINWIVLIRLIEYIVMASAILKFSENLELTTQVVKMFITLNFIVAFLQYINLIGGFNSMYYLEAGNGWLERPFGLMGGPWEFGLTIILSVYILNKGDKYKTLFNGLVLSGLVMAATRMNTIAYLVYMIYYLSNKSRKRFYYAVIIIAIGLIYIINYGISQRYQAIIDLAHAIINEKWNLNLIYSISKIDESLYSRILDWKVYFDLWSNNLISIIFGYGWYPLYLESAIIRTFYSFGFIGVIYLIMQCKKLEIGLFIILVFSSVTLDIFLSQKIFCLTVLALGVNMSRNSKKNEVIYKPIHQY